MAYFNQMSQSQSSHVNLGGAAAFGSMSQSTQFLAAYGAPNFGPAIPVCNLGGAASFGTQMIMNQTSNFGPNPMCNFAPNPSCNFGAPHKPVLCRCNTEARRLTVKKDNENNGRGFYNCRNTVTEGRCGFFAWADEVEPEATWVSGKKAAKPKEIKSVERKKIVNGVIKGKKNNPGNNKAGKALSKTNPSPKKKQVSVKSSPKNKEVVPKKTKTTKVINKNTTQPKKTPVKKNNVVQKENKKSPKVVPKKTEAIKMINKNITQPKKSPVKNNNVVQKENKKSPNAEKKLQIANKKIKLEEKKLRLEKKKLQLEERKLKLASQN